MIFTLASAALAAGGWKEAAPIPAPLAETQAVALGGKIYLWGGLEVRGQSVVTTAAGAVYDPEQNAWRPVARLPIPLNHAAFAALDGKVYATGGVEGWGPVFDRLRTVTFAYDPQADLWTRKADFPSPRWGHALAALEGKLYLAGGIGPDPAALWAYDPAADRWAVAGPPLPTPRDHLAMFAVGGKLYAIGGRVPAQGGALNLRTVEVFDPKAGAWARGRDMPTARGGFAAAELGGKIYAAGGEGFFPNRAFASFEVYDPAADAWAALPDLPTPAHGPAGAALGSQLFVIGGITGGGPTSRFLSQVQVYGPG